MQKLVYFIVFFIIPISMWSQDVVEQQGVYNFVPNEGQWPKGVLYKADVNAGKIWLEEKGILYQFVDNSEVHHADFEHESNDRPEIKQHLIYAQFVGVNDNVSTKKSNPTTEYYNYYVGNDNEKWASKLHGYNQIEYENLYDKIDLVFFENEQELKYEYHVHSGGNYENIKIRYKGQDKVKLQKNGNVVIYTKLGQIIEQKPYVYQIKNGKIIEIASEFVVSESDILSFKLGDYDENLELIIDPILVFATYNGAETDNFGMTATYAYDGKAYTGGIIYGNNYPTPSPAFNTTTNFTGISSANYGITDVFITKYSADGTTLLWTSFIGGGDDTQGTETVHSLICDTLNNIYLYGATSSLDFPMQNAYQSTHSGGAAPLQFYQNGVYHLTNGTDIFVSKLSEDGTALLGSTYVGGSGNDGINYNVFGAAANYNSIARYDSLTSNYGDQFRGEIMLDSLNNVIIASCSRSTDFPATNSFQASSGGQQDGVVFKLAADFNSMLWSTYLGGSENDAAYSVKIDSSYNIVVAGGTSSSNFPNTIGGLSPTYSGGKTDGFVTKIAPDGGSIIQSTYIGTSTYDQTIFVETDRWDNVYIVGVSDGSMPVFNATYSNPNSGQFIMKLSPDLTSIVYSTVFGNGNGQPNISPAAFLVDVCGNVYVSGWGANILQNSVLLSGMPVSANAFQATPPNGFDFYLFVMERDAQSLLYGSYLGDPGAGEHVDGGTSRFDKFGIVYQSVCGGCGGQSNFPTTDDAYSQVNNSSNCNNLVFKFDFEIVPQVDFTVDNLDGCAPLTITFDNESNDTINSVWIFPSNANVISGGINPVVEFPDPGTYEVYLNITDTICNLQDTAKKIITVYPTSTVSVSNDTILCDGGNGSFDITADGFGSVTNFIWSESIDLSNPINVSPMDSVISVNPISSTVYYIGVSNGTSICDVVDSVQVHFLEGAVSVMTDTTICRSDTLLLQADIYSTSTELFYDWSPDNDLVFELDSIAIAVPQSSQYFYFTASILGCSYTDSVFITVDYINPDSVYATANPPYIAEGGAVVLEAHPDSIGYSYQWLPEISVESPNSQTTNSGTISEDQDFTVIVSRGVCSSPTTVTVKALEFECGDVYVFVPNAFTPNNDNENDVIYVRGQNIEIMTFMIFDRWGELVFESTDQNSGWDGTFKGELLDPDVYVYHLRVTCTDGQENLIKGNITLLR